MVMTASESEPPRSFSLQPESLGEVERHVLPDVDGEQLSTEARAGDANRATKPGPYRFAEPIEVALGPDNSGTWDELADGGRLWRLRIVSPGARSLSLGLTTFELPTGVRLWLYGTDREIVQGPYTSADRSRKGRLWTPIVPGDEVTVELHVPADVEGEPMLEIGTVNHAFRGPGKPGT
jgi:hypothetical protein